METTKEIAITILKQLGGNKFIAMTGSNNFVSTPNGLNFQVRKNTKRIKYVQVILTPMDTYTMKFFNSKLDLISEYEDVYCDMLQSIFTNETGYYTSL